MSCAADQHREENLMTRRKRACRIVQVDGEPVRVQGELATPEAVRAFEEIVRAVKSHFAATTCDGCGHQEDRHHHPDDGCPRDPRTTDYFVHRCTCPAFAKEPAE